MFANHVFFFVDQEKQAVDDGALDVVCGFMVIDEDSRMIVLEGLAGPCGGLTALLGRVGRVGPNCSTYRFLENPGVRFSSRLYTCFDADLKKVGRRKGKPSTTAHAGWFLTLVSGVSLSVVLVFPKIEREWPGATQVVEVCCIVSTESSIWAIFCSSPLLSQPRRCMLLANDGGGQYPTRIGLRTEATRAVIVCFGKLTSRLQGS